MLSFYLSGIIVYEKKFICKNLILDEYEKSIEKQG